MKHLLITTIAAVVLVGCGGSIHQAAKDGNIEAVKQHIATGTDVNAKDGYGWPPLHWPAWKGHKEVVELLIAGGADVNARDEDGDTPLDWADRHNQTATTALLRKHGGKTGIELKAVGN